MPPFGYCSITVAVATSSDHVQIATEKGYAKLRSHDKDQAVTVNRNEHEKKEAATNKRRTTKQNNSIDILLFTWLLNRQWVSGQLFQGQSYFHPLELFSRRLMSMSIIYSLS